jgi:hypothetical protein
MALDSVYITVSGRPAHEEQRVDFPSGVFGIPVRAHLSALNATFGFNTSPHKFELEYIPEDFNNEIIPPIGSGVEFTIGDNFYIRGKIIHADFQKSARGNIISVGIEDIRQDLRDIYIDTFGLFGTNDSPANNVIDVRYWYMKNFAERGFGRARVVKDLQLLDEHGASYRQIYDAVKYFENNLGTITNILSKLPTPEIIESQLPFDPDGYRWQFRSQPLLDALVKLLGDVSYDFYWNMQDQKINVINRKFAVDINRDNIPVADDTAEITTLRYGKDEAEEPTSVRILGSQMEGLIGTGQNMIRSGAYGILAGSGGYDLGIDPFKFTLKTVDIPNISPGPAAWLPVFIPGWRGAQVKYFGPDGSERIDYPTDRELIAALKGIEYWAMEKNLDNRISSSTLQPSIGTTNAQQQFTSSAGLGFIDNRGQEGRSWVIEWYNRIRNFAQNHFARTYILHEDTSLHQELDKFEIIDAAWCNIENQKQGGIFEDNYKIDRAFRYLAPFWDHDNNKMRPFAVFAIGTRFKNGIKEIFTPKWGNDGKGVPAQFAEYNESQQYQYVPIEMRKWEQAEDAFQEEFLEFIVKREKGLMLRLPNVCWQFYDNDVKDSRLKNFPVLNAFGEAYRGRTQADIIGDPESYGFPFRYLTDIAIPVRTFRRYGYDWPSTWASGIGTSFELEIREDLAPWKYEPRGTKVSYILMGEEARSALSSRVAFRDIVTFAEIQKLGLPVISFDGFANQNLTNQGYGTISHGVTNLNITKSLDWWQTKYSIKTHFPQFIKVKPVKEVTEEDFRFVIKRLEDRIPLPPISKFVPPPIFEPETEDNRRSWVKSQRYTLTIPVTITRIIDREFGDEGYVGQDDNGNIWPAAFRTGLNLSKESFFFQNRKAKATDGFLQVGMKALYHYEDLEDGSFVHYFTGGVSLAAGRVIELLESPRLVEEVWRANIRTLPETVLDIEGNPVTIDPFGIYNVPFLNQQAVDTTLTNGDKMFMGGTGNDNTLVPESDIGSGEDKDKLYLINNNVPSNVNPAYVVIRPSQTTGLGGSVQTISSAGGQTISDGQTIDGVKYNVRFIVSEYDQIKIGDPCLAFQEREAGQSGEIRLYCFIIKPMFMPTNAFGGQ